METREILSKNIKDMRKERGKSLVEFAEEGQISKSTLQKIETTGNTTVGTIDCVAKNLNVSVAHLFTDQSLPKETKSERWLLQGTQLLPNLPTEQRNLIIGYLDWLVDELNGKHEPTNQNPMAGQGEP